MQAGVKQRSGGGQRGLFGVILLVISWLLIISLSKDVIHLRKGFGRIEGADRRLAEEKLKNEDLKARLNEVMTEEYKEKLIREELNMQKEGEILAVMPINEGVSPKQEENQDVDRNWKKWLDLFR